MGSCRSLLSAQGHTPYPCPDHVELGAGHIAWKRISSTLSPVSGYRVSPSFRCRKTIHREWAASSPMLGGILCAPSSVSRKIMMKIQPQFLKTGQNANKACKIPTEAKRYFRKLFTHEQNFRHLELPCIASSKSAQNQRCERQDGSA